VPSTGKTDDSASRAAQFPLQRVDLQDRHTEVPFEELFEGF